MKIFLDTNILLDIVLERADRKFCETSSAVLTILRQMDVEICLSVISVPTVAYVLKNKPAAQKKRDLRGLLRGMTICPSVDRHVSEAFDGKFKDIEDAMQYACAKDYACDLIITRDAKDFAHSQIAVMTPERFLEEFEKAGSQIKL